MEMQLKISAEFAEWAWADYAVFIGFFCLFILFLTCVAYAWVLVIETVKRKSNPGNDRNVLRWSRLDNRDLIFLLGLIYILLYSLGNDLLQSKLTQLGWLYFWLLMLGVAFCALMRASAEVRAEKRRALARRQHRSPRLGSHDASEVGSNE